MGECCHLSLIAEHVHVAASLPWAEAKPAQGTQASFNVAALPIVSLLCPSGLLSDVVRTLATHRVLSAGVLVGIRLHTKEVKITTVIFLSVCDKKIPEMSF